MKKMLFLWLQVALVVPISAARPVLTKAKWEQMQKGNVQEESIAPETRPMLIEDTQDEESDQTPPPLPPRPTTQPSKVTPPPLPPRPVTPPPLPPRPVVHQPTMTGAGEPVVATKPGLPFTDQDLANQAGKLKTPTGGQQTTKEPLGSFKQQLESKFKGASGSEDELEEEWED